MSNQVFNAHIRAGQPIGDDAGMEEVANWAGYHIEELEAENQRLIVMLSGWYETWNDGSAPDGDLLADTLEALQEDSHD
jgi:hypothetical protein